MDRKAIRIAPDPNASDEGLAHVTDVLAFLISDKDVKRMARELSHVDEGYILTSFKGQYYVKKGGKIVLTTGHGFYFGGMPELKASELYGLVAFLRKCGLKITAGKCDAGYRFI